ncbi:acyl-CoA reductase [Streptomyces flavofungini]|uniref:acyl-CoA reductase n=1 Tax=Streptomyces flavofungini TaxID=68200 RepID=UPI0025B11267|nr:acyl-CoA reductase [Streptomyces flavofungini]WJV47462.1 acyl-CoA reductase [Streptomyces flavofungini]
MSELNHLWQGTWIDDAEAARRLPDLPDLVIDALRRPLGTDVVVEACDRLARVLSTADHPTRARLARLLDAAGRSAEETEAAFAVLTSFLGREGLERKLRAELGDVRPDRLTRPNPRRLTFETWAPVGLVVHVAPGNAPTVGALTVVEGLLSGNVNVVKVPGSDGLFTHELLAALADCDPTGLIRTYSVVLRFGSDRTDWLRLLCGAADAVAVWGGEAAVEGVAAHVPPGCRLVEWGHKISFAYLTAAAWARPDTLRALADDVCRMEQQACSSPQVIYLDTDDTDEVFAFADRFAPALSEASARIPAPHLGLAEQAEITNTEIVAELEEHLGLTRVTAAPDGSWRIIADTRPGLRASPLFRSVWVKPLPRERIPAVLRPMRRYLQTVGLAADRPDTAELTRTLFGAGALRVTAPGSQLDSYSGEPHDGVYALQRYSRRVSLQADERFATDGCLDDLTAPGPRLAAPEGPLTTKSDALAALDSVHPDHAQLHVRSGGSTSGPATWVYTWDDYDAQMRAAGEGLLAAGFDPRHDRAANLFMPGQMYGSFTSFFDILERLAATQIPYGVHADFQAVADALIRYRVNTLFGAPSYLLQLFAAEGERLRDHGHVEKVFYGGAHLTDAQRQVLHDEFGVKVVRSAIYGSNDLGPMGYQCDHAAGAVHHLFTTQLDLEILDRTADRPAPADEPGRLVFTPRTRLGQRLDRYETGDLGRWIPGDCACGRRTPRFELLGRYGDSARVGAFFISHQHLTRVAAEAFGYAGELQLILSEGLEQERLTIRLDRRHAPDPATARRHFLDHYGELRNAVEEARMADVEVHTIDSAHFERGATSGKLRNIIDRRPAATGRPAEPQPSR